MAVSVSELRERIFVNAPKKGTPWHRCNIWVESDKTYARDLINRWYIEAGGKEASMPEYDFKSNKNVWYIRVSLAKSLNEKDETHKFWRLFLQVVDGLKECAKGTKVKLSTQKLEKLKEDVLFTWGTTVLNEQPVTGYINHDEGKSAFKNLLKSLLEAGIQLVLIIEDFEEYEQLYKNTGDGGLALFLFSLSAKSRPWLPMTLLLVSTKAMEAEIRSNMGEKEGDGSDFFAAYEMAQ